MQIARNHKWLLLILYTPFAHVIPIGIAYNALHTPFPTHIRTPANMRQRSFPAWTWAISGDRSQQPDAEQTDSERICRNMFGMILYWVFMFVRRSHERIPMSANDSRGSPHSVRHETRSAQFMGSNFIAAIPFPPHQKNKRRHTTRNVSEPNQMESSFTSFALAWGAQARTQQFTTSVKTRTTFLRSVRLSLALALWRCTCIACVRLCVRVQRPRRIRCGRCWCGLQYSLLSCLLAQCYAVFINCILFVFHLLSSFRWPRIGFSFDVRCARTLHAVADGLHTFIRRSNRERYTQTRMPRAVSNLSTFCCFYETHLSGFTIRGDWARIKLSDASLAGIQKNQRISRVCSRRWRRWGDAWKKERKIMRQQRRDRPYYICHVSREIMFSFGTCERRWYPGTYELLKRKGESFMLFVWCVRTAAHSIFTRLQTTKKNTWK